ncbi:MAG: glycosyltransferase family 4 protein [Acidobacteriota bacterium]
MKIVHVVYSLEMGGAEVLVAQLTRLQRANGHQVSVCAYSNLGTLGEALQAEGVEVYVPGKANSIVTMVRYLNYFRRLQPDVVHCHNNAPTIQAALSARLAGVRTILSTCHSLNAPPYDRAAEIKYNTFTLFCDYIVGICEITCRNLRSAPFAHPEKIVRVYNGTDAINRVPAAQQLAKTGFTLLFVGRLAPVKNLGTIIRAVAIAAQTLPTLQCWFVGDGHERASLEALTAELNVTANIRFWGQRLDPETFFSAADAFVMSSVSEGLPMSLLQAMSLGVPSILTDVGGMAEVLRLANAGLLVPVGDHAAFATAILQLAADPALRAAFSTNAQASFHQHFTLTHMDAAYTSLYNHQQRSWD